MALTGLRCAFVGLIAVSAYEANADGVALYASEQVRSGQLEYVPKCGVCHGVDLNGAGAPALKGAGFVAKWNGKTLNELYTYTRDQMPKGAGNSLPGQAYADIVAFMLAQNGLPAGSEKLTPQTPMERVLALSDATSQSAQSAPAAPVKLGALAGAVKQPSTSAPTQAELDSADDSTSDWLMYNKGYRGERYSRLTQLNAHTANDAASALHVPARRARHVPDRSRDV